MSTSDNLTFSGMIVGMGCPRYNRTILRFFSHCKTVTHLDFNQPYKSLQRKIDRLTHQQQFSINKKHNFFLSLRTRTS